MPEERARKNLTAILKAMATVGQARVAERDRDAVDELQREHDLCGHRDAILAGRGEPPLRDGGHEVRRDRAVARRDDWDS